MNQNGNIEECKIEKTISILKANLYTALLIFPVGAGLYFLYYAMYGFPLFAVSGQYVFQISIFLVGILCLVFLHEFIHGFVWHFFCKNSWQSIKFGFVPQLLTPYCHCKEKLLIRHYRFGTIAPLLITGIIPYLLSLLTANYWLMITGLVMILAAGGDMLVLLLLIGQPAAAMVQDHQSLCGCSIYYHK